MKKNIRYIIIKILIIGFIGFFCTQVYAQKETQPISIVIHGGAGNFSKENLSSADIEAYTEKIKEALNAGYEILSAGGNSVEAVEKAIIVLEDSPLFNAGKGAVYTAEGHVELDASIMCGETLEAGAVAGVTCIKNPISAAYMVMKKTEHVLLIGKGAEEFAKNQKLECVDESYFYNEKRWQQYINKKERGSTDNNLNTEKFGTVGAVAFDKKGNLAAGTSTGGMNYKKHGRVGDSPIIGAGTYADNRYAAVSATGQGEFFIRNVVAYDIIALMAYKKWKLDKAANHVINNKLKNQKADGGVICIDSKGNIVWAFNTKAMFRGYINAKGEMKIEIF